ncbi:MAG: DUF6484 domain-containing protein [Variovorax sp.]
MAAKRKPHASPERAPQSTSAEAGTQFVNAAATVVVGRLLPGSTAMTPLVDFPGNARGPLRARTTMILDAAGIDRAIVTGQAVALVFESGDPRLPIVTGLIQTEAAATPFQELLVSARPAPPATSGRPGGTPRLEARLDGERVVLEGKKEIVLKCGEASITLRSDGKMVLRGAYIETYAKGVNRIKGASVKIN